METVAFKKYEKDFVWFKSDDYKIDFPVPAYLVGQEEVENGAELSKYERYLDKYLFDITKEVVR
jgi:hypothetical protein